MKKLILVIMMSFMMISFNVSAESWVYSKTGKNSASVTVGNNSLAVYEDLTGITRTGLLLGSLCKNGISSPILVASSRGTYHADLICAKNGILIFGQLNYSEVITDIRNGSYIDFISPMKSRKVSVLRFPLYGSRAVIDKVERARQDRKASEDGVEYYL